MPNLTTQKCAPWTLRAWPPLLWQVSGMVPLHLAHLGTQVTRPGQAGCPIVGQTMWACRRDDLQAGMAWDWIQLPHGIVAMADPMSVVTNLTLVSPEGELLSELESARHLNGIVHCLPWQDEVERAMVEQRLLQ
jgi:hypothetical protein